MHGGVPFEGAEVQVHYVGTLLSDGSKFDSSRDRPGNFSFKIGKGQVIKGWDKGVATMHKGEKAELFCRADYAYGEGGSPPKIPGGATLKFEVELLSWAEPNQLPPEVPMTDDGDGEEGAAAAGGASAALATAAVAGLRRALDSLGAVWASLLALPSWIFSLVRSMMARPARGR